MMINKEGVSGMSEYVLESERFAQIVAVFVGVVV